MGGGGSDSGGFRPMGDGRNNDGGFQSIGVGGRDSGGFRPLGGIDSNAGGFRTMGSGGNDGGSSGLDNSHVPPSLTGQKRGNPFSSRERSPGTLGV